MPDWLMAMFRPPVFADEEKTQSARVFHRIAWGVILIATVFLSVILLAQPNVRQRTLGVLATVDLLCLALLELNRRGWTRAASALLIGGLIIRVTLNALAQGGVRSPGMSFFLVSALMGGLLLGENGGLLAAAAGIFAALGLTLAEVFGALPPRTVRFNPFALLSLECLYMGVAVVLVRLTTQSLREALRRAQTEILERRNAEKRLELALASGEIGVWELDPKTSVFLADERAFSLLGVSAPADRKLSMEDWKALILPEDAAAVLEPLQRLIEGAPNARANYRIIRPDGEVRYIDGAGTSILGETGRPRSIIGTIMDVTDRRTAEAKRERLLYDYKERIKEATAMQQASALLLDPSISVSSLLKSLANILPPAFQFPEITQARLRYGSNAVQTDGFKTTPWQLGERFATQDKTEGSIEVIYTEARPPSAEGPFFAEERRLLETLARMLRTALERRSADERVQSQERRFRALVENIGDGIAVIDAEGVMTYDSDSSGRVLGYKDGEFVGNSLRDFVHPEDASTLLAGIQRACAAPEALVVAEPTRLRHKDGSWVWVEGSIRNRLADPAIQGLVVAYRDVTARKKLQTDLLQAQKLEAMGRLSGGVAHDFNNILTAILGFAGFLKQGLEPSDPRHDDAQQVIESAKRAAGLTRQLLAFSRKQVLQPVALDLNAIIQDMEKMLQRIISEDIALRTRLDPALGCCRADRGQIEQVILNLVVNARDAMPKGGAITVATSNVALDSSAAAAFGASPGQFVRIEVVDTGEGMSEETLRRIFEPFFTTKPEGKGTGLGLSTVHGIVKQSEGFLRVRSALGKGSTFEVLLPAAARPEPAAAPPAPGRPQRARSETVLLLDDDATVRKMAHRLLTAAGYRILEADGGPAALELLEREHPPIDLLITDVVMPEMGGFDLAREVHRRHRGVRVLFISGYLDREQPPDTLDFKFDYLQKPFSSEDFTAKVRAILDAPA